MNFKYNIGDMFLHLGTKNSYIITKIHEDDTYGICICQNGRLINVTIRETNLNMIS